MDLRDLWIISDLIHPYLSLSTDIYRDPPIFLVFSEETDGTFFSEAVESGRPMCLGEISLAFFNNDHFIYLFPTAGPVGFQSLGLGLARGDLQPSKSGMEPWNPGTLEPWNPGTLEPWGTLGNPGEPWGTLGNPGTLEPWNLGILENLESWKTWNLGTLEPWNPGTLKPWNPGTLEPRNPGTLKPWNLGTLRPWNPETLEPWHPGTLKDSGTLQPWNPATLHTWNFAGILEP